MWAPADVWCYSHLDIQTTFFFPPRRPLHNIFKHQTAWDLCMRSCHKRYFYIAILNLLHIHLHSTLQNTSLLPARTKRASAYIPKVGHSYTVLHSVLAGVWVTAYTRFGPTESLMCKCGWKGPVFMSLSASLLLPLRARPVGVCRSARAQTERIERRRRSRRTLHCFVKHSLSDRVSQPLSPRHCLKGKHTRTHARNFSGLIEAAFMEVINTN